MNKSNITNLSKQINTQNRCAANVDELKEMRLNILNKFLDHSP